MIRQYLRRADDVLPGRIEGLYPVGSVALGDYQAGSSDIDFVAVTADPLTSLEHDHLRSVHRDLLRSIGRPWFDGIYLTWTDLARDPEDTGTVACTHEGVFAIRHGFEANPAVWLTIRKYPVAIRGTGRPGIWHDEDAIRRWNIENLDSYWRGRVRQQRSIGRRTATLAVNRLLNSAVSWCIPGVARLHYTIRTGNITSKSGACRYALGAFPDRWHTVIREALALRSGERPAPRSRVARQRDVADFMEFVINDVTVGGADVPG